MPYADVNNGQIYYEIDGQGDNLLLLHGVTGSITNWMYVRPLLRQHFRVILPELRGHGRSTKLTEVSDMDIFTDDMLRLLDVLEIEDCFVVGHSMGGSIAQLMALSAPSRVKALVLICTGHKIDEELAQEYLRLGMAMYGLSPAESVEKALELLFYDPEKIRQTPGMIEILRKKYEEKQAFELSHGYAQGAITRFNVEAQLGEIQAPTLIIQGAHDTIFALRFGKYLRDHIPNAIFQIIDETAHEIQFEQPEAMVKAIVKFRQSLK